MTTQLKPREKTRVQVDLNQAELALLELLQRRLSVRSRTDLLQQAYGTFLWVVDEMLSGRRVISVDSVALAQVDRFRELSIPAVAPALFAHYQYLVQRPEMGRSQPYLKGRNMTVGQLVYRMRANGLDAEQAAADLDLPLAQVQEAQVCYTIHADLIDSEMAEEGRVLQAHGVSLEPQAVSG